MFEFRKTRQGIARFGDPLLCPQCASGLRRELAAIDTMAAVVAADADGHRGSTGSDAAIRAHRNAGSKGSPSPAHDFLDDLVSVLRGYVVIKRPVANRLGQVGRAVTELASWLIMNLNMYLYDPALAGKLAADVHTWHWRLEKRSKTGAPLDHKPVPCPSCRKMGLEQERGSDVVKCRLCGLIQPAGVYEDAVADGAAAADGADERKQPAPRRRKTAGSTST